MKNIATQNGSIQIKMSEYYTATCRNINDLERMLNDANESKEALEILSIYNVSKEFEVTVRAMIKNFLNPTTKKLQYKTLEVELSNCDKMHKSFTINVEVREDNKIRVLGDGFGDWVFKFQTVKTTGKGDYVKMYGNRVYFAWTAPTYN